MGTNTLETQTDGTIIDVSDVNQYKTALNQDHVPRNSSGVATDDAGGLGTSLLRWSTSYIKKIFIGTSANNNAITENGADLSFEVGGSEVFKLTTNGLERGQLPSVGEQTSSASGASSTGSTSFVDVPNLSVSLTTTGRPVILRCIPDTAASFCSFTGTGPAFEIQYVRDSTGLGVVRFDGNDNGMGHVGFDAIGAGTYTYKVQIRTVTSGLAFWNNLKLVAYEL